jgi:hypothetical protein
VYGSDLEAGGGGEDAAAAEEGVEAAAAAADGSASPAVDAAAAAAAAASVDGLVKEANGDVPFFLMDAYEAPERQGEKRTLAAELC